MNATSGCQYDFSPKNVAKFKQLSEQTVGGTASFRFPESVFVFFFVSSVPLCEQKVGGTVYIPFGVLHSGRIKSR
jgi:hypothetical protein